MAGLAGEAARRRGCCFGPPAAGVLLTYTGGRWKLWNEKAAAVEVSHSDPAETYTAACWGTTAVSSSSAGGQRMALGCASGRVQVWEPNTYELACPVAEAFHAVARGTDCAVSALAMAQPHRAAVFVGCYAVPEVLEVGLLDGKTRATFQAGKGSISKLAMSMAGTEWLLSAGTGSTLKLWHLPGGSAGDAPRAHARLAGPANAASCIDICSKDSRMFALCADGTMQVDLFMQDEDLDAAGGSRKAAPLNAAFVLSSREQIRGAYFVHAGAHAAGDGGAGLPKKPLSIVGFGSTLVACWSLSAEQCSGPIKDPATLAPVFIVSADGLGGRVLCARLGAPQAPLVVAFGAMASPAFAEVRAPATKGGSVVIQHTAAFSASRGPAGDGATPAAAKGAVGKEAAGAAAQPTVLGPLEAAVARRQPQRKRAAEEGKARGEAGEGEGAVAAKFARLAKDAPAPGGLSIAPMVRQGLRSKDGPSIEKVVQTADRRVIDSTVAELSGVEAFDLLQECTRRLLSQPIRGQVLCTWIQRVLLHHCTYISSQPALHDALQPLRDAFQARCSSYRTLLRLQGWLHTLRNYGRQALENRARERETVRAPLLEYVEGDEDVEEASGEDASSDRDGADDAGGESSDMDDIFADDSDD